MSEEQARGRRRPSREFHSLPAPSVSTEVVVGRRLRDEEIKTEEGQPQAKIIKKDPSTVPIEPSLKADLEEISEEEGEEIVASTSKPAVKKEFSDLEEQKRYEIFQTRPSDISSKAGKTGKEIDLTTNYFRLITNPDWSIFQYHVEFEPEIELRFVRNGILSEHRALFGGYLYDGIKLFSTNRLREDKTIIKCQSRKGFEYTLTVIYVGTIAMDQWQALKILNIILRRAMEGLKLQLVGRNFFDPVAKIDLSEFRLQLWPGYHTSIRQHENDILLCSEVAHKVMRTETVYDILMKAIETARDYRDEFRRQVLGLTVLTDYNNKTYRISDVNFDSNPKKTFLRKGKEISFLEYYEKRYKIRIRDTKQPLLISRSKERDRRRGFVMKSDETVILIPELCRATGLTDNMRSNFQLMRAMADHTRLNPERRMDRLKVFNQRLQKNPGSQKVLKDWNMCLDKHLVKLKGRVIDPQRIVFGSNNKLSAGELADWTRLFRDNSLFTTPSRGLERWSVVGPARSTRDIRNFIEALLRAAKTMQMKIGAPREVFIYDDRNHSYIQAMEECARLDPQLIMCLVPNANAERYATIKKKCCIERAIPTQVVTHKSAANPRGLMSIATKVAIQMNCKLGYTPWMIDIPLSGLMTIGYDVAKSTRDRAKAFGALVASMDMKTNATFYSTVTECNSKDVLASSLWAMMTKALRQYRKEHENKMPNRILFYRDGVSEGSLRQIYDCEVKDIVGKLEEEYKRYNVEKGPMFAYVIVTKSINTRFFAKGVNPPAGTIVDSVVTLPERYDFYLVSQSVRQGTVAPTSYNIVYSTMKLTPDQMQLLTYKMTHLYYNWSGTTRVPAVCQYAKKLASLVATSLHKPPQNILEKKLFYL